MARGNFFGYEPYMICEDGFRNIEQAGRAVGFQLNMRLANYRGYILSQIEDIRVSIDNAAIPREDIRFSVGKKTYTLDEMENVVDDRWELRQTATITCLKPGGLAAGPHEIKAEQHVRASYIPIVAVAYASKRLVLA